MYCVTMAAYVEPPDAYGATVLSDVRAWFAQDKEMQRKRGRLVSVCCASDLPIPLQRAPKPASIFSA